MPWRITSGLKKSKENLLITIEHVSGDLKIDMEFVLSRGLRFKRLLSQGQFDLVSQELDVFEKELDDLARSFGVELDRLPEEPSPID